MLALTVLALVSNTSYGEQGMDKLRTGSTGHGRQVHQLALISPELPRGHRVLAINSYGGATMLSDSLSFQGKLFMSTFGLFGQKGLCATLHASP